MQSTIIFRQLFDERTWTYSYIIGETISHKAIIIDPVRDQVDRDILLLEELGLKLSFILDTHIHADHITGSGILREKTGASIIMGEWTKIAKPDILIKDSQTITLGDIHIQAISTPGHTDSCTSFITEDMVFTWDTLLIRKTGRTDFQWGSAEILYQSIQQKLYTLPDNTRVFPGHDYTGRMMSTIWEEKLYNTRIRHDTKKEDFILTMSLIKLESPKYIDIALPANRVFWMPV